LDIRRKGGFSASGVLIPIREIAFLVCSGCANFAFEPEADRLHIQLRKWPMTAS